MDLIFYAIFGAVLVLLFAFFSLWFVSKKKTPEQGLVSQLASNISAAQHMDDIPEVMPVEVVTPNPATTTQSNISTQALNPQGDSMVQSAQGAMPINPDLAGVEINNQQKELNTAAQIPLQDVNKKIQELDKKLEEVNSKLEKSNF